MHRLPVTDCDAAEGRRPPRGAIHQGTRGPIVAGRAQSAELRPVAASMPVCVSNRRRAGAQSRTAPGLRAAIRIPALLRRRVDETRSGRELQRPGLVQNVAASKLCSRENLSYIDQGGGRFVTVVPRSRMEDGEFREWIQTHNPAWEKVLDEPNRRRADGPRDCWYVCPAPMPASEGWPIIWVYRTILGLRQEFRRRKNLTAAEQALTCLRDRLAAARARLRGAAQIDREVAEILQKYSVGRYLKVRRVVREQHLFKQTKRGRPGPDTAYRKPIFYTKSSESLLFQQLADAG